MATLARPYGKTDLGFAIGGRPAALTTAIEALREGAVVEDLYADLFQDALYEVGRLWETNATTVAQEHMATAVTQYVMAHVFGQIAPPPTGRGLAIMTGVPGELHHIGALMVCDMLEANGWQVQRLGSNLPIPAILNAIAEAKPQLLGISITMLFNVHHATRLIAEAKRAARSDHGRRPRIGIPVRIVARTSTQAMSEAPWRSSVQDAVMILAMSRFKVANGMEGAVAEAVANRPGLVDEWVGFLGLETFTDITNPSVFHLMTRWTDRASFHAWHHSADHRASHRGMPKGLRLDPSYTELVELERVPRPGALDATGVSDASAALAAYFERSRVVHLLRCDAKGTSSSSTARWRTIWGSLLTSFAIVPFFRVWSSMTPTFSGNGSISTRSTRCPRP